MARAIYRKGKAYADKVCWLLVAAAHPERDGTLDAYHLELVRYARRGISPRALACLHGYYVQGKGMMDIAAELGVNVSTVSRNILRGDGKIDEMVKLAQGISPIQFGP